MKKYPIYSLHTSNFNLIIASILVIILSYFLFFLGSKYNSEIVSLTIAPIMQLLGYSTIIYSIIKS